MTSQLDIPCLPPPPPAAEPERRPRILIVDDCAMNRELVGRILEAEGFLVAAAADHAAALEALGSTRVDLILLDVCLPNFSGIELCQLLQADRALRKIPVIFLSAMDEPSDRLRGLEAGGVDYITKPFYPDEVLARVRIHLRLEEAFRRLARVQESQMAELRDAQRAILVTPDELPEASFAVCYRPLEQVGGDIYDVLRLGGGDFGYLVGDISGHGVGASFLTSAVHALLRQYTGPLYPPEETLRRMNAVMQTIVRDGQHLTACYGRFARREGVFSFVNAGHPAPIHARRSARPLTFPAESEPIGLFDSIALARRDVAVFPGDRIYLYTDGLIESPDLPAGGRRRGMERLCRACEECAGLRLADAVNAIVDRARRQERKAADDVLLVGVEVPE